MYIYKPCWSEAGPPQTSLNFQICPVEKRENKQYNNLIYALSFFLIYKLCIYDQETSLFKHFT